MRVSIVIPAHGQQDHLLRALETWHVQRDEFSELIVVDDGSPTPLYAPEWVRMERIERAPDPRGSSAAKNHGAARATGDYLCFADADILQLPDCMMSMKSYLRKWEDEGQPDVLLNVARYGIPQGYPMRRTRNVEGLLKRLTVSGELFDPDLQKGNNCWEQNCSLIRRELFDRVGGYDADTFKSWGFNNHDLCMRVYLAGGRVSSSIPRTSTGKRLYCFHLWHDAPRDRETADAEFASKWGEKWTHGLMGYVQFKASERNGENLTDWRPDDECSAVQG